MARVELKGIAKRYGASTALQPTSLLIEDGEFLVILGPSGCGKSTLLRIVAGLIEPSLGDVRIDGESVLARTPRERDVALVFQNYALYPHKTVARNLSFPLEVRGLSRASIEQRVRETAQLLGLEALLERKPGELSGGQMQRVALGRALVREPRLFLFDEPLSNLDAATRAELRREIAALHARLGVTTLYVTHDQVEALTLGARIALMRNGVIEQVGTPLEVFRRPANTFVATFLGSPPMNLVPLSIESGRYSLGGLSHSGAPVDQGAVVLGFRPHKIEVCPAGAGGLPARVEGVERLGGRCALRLRLADAVLVVEVGGDFEVEPGAPMNVTWPPREINWFDGAGDRLERAP